MSIKCYDQLKRQKNVTVSAKDQFSAADTVSVKVINGGENIMSINNINNTNKPQLDAVKLAQQQAQSATSGGANTAGAAQSAAPAKQDSVSLTQSAQQLASVQKKGGEAPVNQEKVERLKKAINDGEYRVNPEVLANKIAVLESQILGVKA